MRLVNPHRFGSITPATVVYDNVSAMYTLRKPSMTTLWTKAVIKVYSALASSSVYVFFDTNGEISNNSLTSTSSYDSASTTTLGTWDVADDDLLLVAWIGINSSNTVDTNTILESSASPKSPILKYGSGVGFVKSNGKNAISFEKSTHQEIKVKIPMSELDTVNNFSIMSVAENNLADSKGYYAGNSTSETDGLSLYINTSKSKEIARFSPFFMQLKSINLSLNQREALFTNEPVFREAWLNNISQETNKQSTTWNNYGFVLGGSNSEIFVGKISEIIIMDTSVRLSSGDYFNEVNTYYSTY